MNANCIFCNYLNPLEGWGDDTLGKCRIRKTNVRNPHKNCTTFRKMGPYYMGHVKWLRRKAAITNRVAQLIEDEGPKFFSEQVKEAER